jgi:hypothetical protein
MIKSHLFLMALYAACVAVVGAVLVRDDRPGQLKMAGTIFAAFLGAAIVGGWLLYVLPL